MSKWLIANVIMQVYPAPTIAVLSTGDELVEPTYESLSRGQVVHTYYLICYSTNLSLNSIGTYATYLGIWFGHETTLSKELAK